MMSKIINKHWSVFQINPVLQETFQNNPFVAFKRNKNSQEIIGGHTIKNGKMLIAQSIEKENVNLATQVNHHYIVSRSLTPAYSEVTKHGNHTPYFTN